MRRNTKILLERAHGKTVIELADEYGINPSRIHQIEVRECEILGVSTKLNPTEIGCVVMRLEEHFRRGVNYDSPEWFYRHERDVK
jgi:hypothetical protein